MSFCSWFSSEKYKDHFEHGVYLCSQCEQPLFPSRAKYEHSSPWPAFTSPVTAGALKKLAETESTETQVPCWKVLCASCDNPLGHEFIGDGPDGCSRF